MSPGILNKHPKTALSTKFYDEKRLLCRALECECHDSALSVKVTTLFALYQP